MLLLHVRRLESFVVGLHLFSDGSNADFVVFRNTTRVSVQVCVGPSKTSGLSGCLVLGRNLLYHWELHSVLAQLTHKHLSSQQGTVTLLSMYWICVESSHCCSPLNYKRSSLRLDCTSGIWHENCDWCTSIFSIVGILSLDNHLDVLHDHLLATETSSAFRVGDLIIIIWRFSSPP